jgi:hypothetical protein
MSSLLSANLAAGAVDCAHMIEGTGKDLLDGVLARNEMRLTAVGGRYQQKEA